MRDSGLTPAPIILESRQLCFAARLAILCSYKLKEQHKNPSSGTRVGRAVQSAHEHGWTTEGMSWAALGKHSVVRTIIPEDASAAKRAVQRWAREDEANAGVDVGMWWTDGSRSDGGRVGAAAVCNHRDRWRSPCSYLGTGRLEEFDTKMWAIGLTLEETIEKSEIL